MRRSFIAAFLVIGSFVGFSSAHADERAESTAVVPQVNLNALMQPVALADSTSFPVQLSTPRSLSAERHTGVDFGMGAVYASTALMHILDIDSTFKALDRGAVEANPLMSGLVKNKSAFILTKAAIAGATIYATHRMAKHNKVGAIITSMAINSAYLMIVKNNYAIANR